VVGCTCNFRASPHLVPRLSQAVRNTTTDRLEQLKGAPLIPARGSYIPLQMQACMIEEPMCISRFLQLDTWAPFSRAKAPQESSTTLVNIEQKLSRNLRRMRNAMNWKHGKRSSQYCRPCYFASDGSLRMILNHGMHFQRRILCHNKSVNISYIWQSIIPSMKNSHLRQLRWPISFPSSLFATRRHGRSQYHVNCRHCLYQRVQPNGTSKHHFWYRPIRYHSTLLRTAVHAQGVWDG
jgi:hypothetical protein